MTRRTSSARELLLQELIPIARDGPEALQVPNTDIDYYLGVIEARTNSGRTGARWLLDSLENVPVEERDLLEAAVAIITGDGKARCWRRLALSPGTGFY